MGKKREEKKRGGSKPGAPPPPPHAGWAPTPEDGVMVLPNKGIP